MVITYLQRRASSSDLSFVTELAAAEGPEVTTHEFYNILARRCLRTQPLSVIDQILDDVDAMGVESPIAIYETTMRGLAGRKAFKSALRVYVRGSRVDAAWELYHVMTQEAALPPDKFTCTTLVKALQMQRGKLTHERILLVLNILEKVVSECEVDLGLRQCMQQLFELMRAHDEA